jgi:hydrogenase maturation protease
MPKKKSNILIAGLGNVLLRDDGVGVHAIRQLQRHSIRGTTAVEVGCAIFDVLPLLDSADKILLIDAMKAQGSPGTIYTCGLRDLELSPTKGSLHGLSLLNALQTFVRPSPRVVRLVGIEPSIIDYGIVLSESVQASLSQVRLVVKEIVEEWTF